MDYQLNQQVGFVLRQVVQRHSNIFSGLINNDLTPTQFSALAKLQEIGVCSQNMLGRHTAMDAATIKGVIDRLRVHGLIKSVADPEDKRRVLIALTSKGKEITAEALIKGLEITTKTLAPLNKEEQQTLLSLLNKIK